MAASVITISCFRQAPSAQVKRIFGYLANLPHGVIRYRIHESEYSDLPHKNYNRARTVYTGEREELPYDLPEPLGKQVTSTHYVDANLHHDLVTSKAVTVILHMFNAIPVHWHCRRQSTVETAIGSEFVAASYKNCC